MVNFRREAKNMAKECFRRQIQFGCEVHDENALAEIPFEPSVRIQANHPLGCIITFYYRSPRYEVSPRSGRPYHIKKSRMIVSSRRMLMICRIFIRDEYRWYKRIVRRLMDSYTEESDSRSVNILFISQFKQNHHIHMSEKKY